MNRASASLIAATAMLGACASAPLPPREPPAASAPERWQAALPHQGQTADLTLWWQQFDDPLLAQLIAAAQAASPSLAEAASRIEQARAVRTGAGAALGPALDASAGVARARSDFVTPLGNTAQASLRASWELDLFGGNRAALDAAQARFEGAAANWHAARVSLAAEVALGYTALRTCELLLTLAQADADSRAETARLTELVANAGFVAPASAALARASAAQGRGLVTQQRARCDIEIKSLAELSAVEEPALRAQLAPRSAQLPVPALIGVREVPAEALAQRPDLYGAEREVVAAAAETAQVQAQRYPHVSLAGWIGPARFESPALTLSGTLWSFGPLQVSVPLFDGGARAANVEAARARYDAALVAYGGRLRTAVREVEEALVLLQSTAARGDDARIAVAGFDDSLRATDARFRGGLATLFELEDARRSALLAKVAQADLEHERVAAWVSLYRALGGGWSPAELQAGTPEPTRGNR